MSPRRAKAVGGRIGDDPATALRDHLIDATERLLAGTAIGSVTTRDIARAAEVSDGVLYNYFADKNELILAALIRRQRALARRFYSTLPEPGSATVEDNLVALTAGLLEMIAEALPTVAGLVTQPVLFHRLFEEIHRDEYSPQEMQRRVTAYLEAERSLDRIHARDLSPAGPLLMGLVLTIALSYHLAPPAADRPLEAQLRPAVAAILRGLE
jgi:AcrR family transcriptional regulator